MDYKEEYRRVIATPIAASTGSIATGVGWQPSYFRLFIRSASRNRYSG
jgi:hypothetical protein